MRRLALVFSAALVASSSCIAAPAYVEGTAGGGGTGTGAGGGAGPGTGAGGAGGEGGVTQIDPPAPAWCRFHGTVNNETLFDLRRAPADKGLVGGGGFTGPLVFDQALTPLGSSDGYIAYFDQSGEPGGAYQVGASQIGVVGSLVVSDAGQVFGLGTLVGDLGAFVGDGSEDLFAFEAGVGPVLAAGTALSDGLFDGQTFGSFAYLTGDSDAPGLDLGTGAISSGGVVAGLDLATSSVVWAIPLGAGNAPGSGHNIKVTASGDAWASVALGGPGLTDVVCNGENLVTTAPRQPALLKLGPDGVCTRGRLLPSEMFEDLDLAVLDGERPVLSGHFTGTMIVDGVEATSQAGLEDAFFAVFDDNGDLVTLTTYGGLGTETPNELVLDAAGDAYVVGEFLGSFRAGTMTAESLPDGAQAVFVLKMAPTGQIRWATAFGGDGYQAASALVLDVDGNLFVGGHTAGSIACASPAPQIVGGTDIFIMRFDAATL